jgi:DnaJ-class molecular chaperone
MQQKKLIAFFKGTASEFNRMGSTLACSLMAAAADMRNHVSPITKQDCTACNSTGYVVVPNGPDDIYKELCANCNGTGQVVVGYF